MISNPCKWFATGGSYDDQRSFTYEGGSKLFHFSPRDNGLEKNMQMNIVFFANDEEHALDVLRRMLEFKIECKRQYIQASLKRRGAHDEEFAAMAEKEEEAAVRYLAAIKAGEVKLELAPTNQFYVVGWADNDVI